MSPIQASFRILRLTAGSSDAESKKFRRLAGAHLQRVLANKPELLKQVLAEAKKEAVADPRITAIKRAMVPAVRVLSAWLQQQTDKPWGEPKARDVSWAPRAEYWFSNYDGKNIPSVIELSLTPSEESDKVVVTLRAYQGHGNSRGLAHQDPQEILLKDLRIPSKVFSTAFMAKLKKGLGGDFSGDIEYAVENCSDILEAAEEATKLAQTMKDKLEALKEGAKPTDIVQIINEFWTLSSAGDKIKSNAGGIQSLSERLKRYL